MDHRTRLQSWVDALERVQSEMKQYIARIPDADDSEEIKNDIKSAMLSVDDASFEIDDIIKKLA